MIRLQDNDLIAAIKNNELWTYLAWQDIRLRYRRSKIGPFWITLSMAIFCLALGAVYSQLFKMEIAEYLPFLTAGFILWGLISSILSESPNLYIDSASYIKDIRINPISVLLRVITRNIIIFTHNLLIIVGVYIYFGINPGLSLLYLVPGLILVLLNLIAISVPLSLIGTRYRDVAPMTQAIIQIIFFVTPLTWFPKLVSNGSWIIKINPFAYYLDLTRSPILGHAPQLASWLVGLTTLLIFSTLAYVMYKAKASRIPFWL